MEAKLIVGKSFPKIEHCNPGIPVIFTFKFRAIGNETIKGLAKCILMTMDTPHWTLQNGLRVELLSLEAVRVMRVELLK
jgi:hypothetical protein